MGYKKPKYDGACYYAGKLMGRCTVADGNTYSALMEECGGNAARVLQEYAYFSPELRNILEKVAAVQEKQRSAHKTPGVFPQPENSPWGEVQHCDTLCTGVFMVSTAGHGGTMITKDMTAVLSPAARKCGMKHGGFLCFEEDTEENIVLRELLDKKLWAIPDRIKDKAAFEESINAGLRKCHPDYWRVRQGGREKAPARPAVPVHSHVAEL